MNDPTLWHQRTCKRIIVALDNWSRAAGGRGEVGFGGNWSVAPGQVYKPDAWWVPAERRLDLRSSREDDPPALAVEVRSPGTWRFDVGRKRQVYSEVGVRELWLVDMPASTVLVFRRSRAEGVGFDDDAEFGPGEILSSPLLEGFELPIDGLFED